MDIIFEGYTAGHMQVRGSYPLTTRFTQRSAGGGGVPPRAPITAVFTSRLSLAATFSGAQDGHAAIRAKHAPSIIFFADRSGGIFRTALPFDASWAGDTPRPDVGLVFGNLYFGTTFTGTQTNNGDIRGNHALTTFLTDGQAAFRIAAPLTTAFRDTSPDRVPERGAFMVQQPMLFASMSVGITTSLLDLMQANDSHCADFIHALMDLIQFNDAYSQLAQVLQALEDGISLSDVAQMIWEAGLLDVFIASAVPENTAQITVLLADAFDASDVATALSDILAALSDGFYATLTINTGDDTYTAWVMTPETKAVRSYSNFPFNSYATLGPHFLGAAADGIYRMGGTTDDGVAIRSSIRTGLMNFGSRSMKAVNRAYIGATTAGNLLLRVQATTADGRDLEQTYRLIPANTGAPREHRVGVGRGFRSVYWTFELANDTDGANFEVHDWHVLPVTLTGNLI